MPSQGPRRLPAGERDRRLAEEVLYLHSLWRRGPRAPAPAPVQSRSARREELDRRALCRQERERLTLYRVLRRKERKRRRIDSAAAEAALAPPPPASSRETLAEAAGASAPSTANPPPPTTPPGPLAQREAARSMVEFTNHGSTTGNYDEGSGSDGDKAEEEEAAVYFTELFQRDAWLRGHYTKRWRKGRFQCLVCAARGGKKVGKAVRRFRGCSALLHHARAASRARSRCGMYGRRGAHRALVAVVCRMLGWDIETLALPRVVIDPRAKAGVQPAKENDGAGKNNGYSTEDDSYSIDEDEESEDDESVDEEDIEAGMPDPGTDGDEEDSEIDSNEEFTEKEDCENTLEDLSTDGDEDANVLVRNKDTCQKEDADTGAEGSKITDGDTEAIELDNSEKIPEKEAANNIARKRGMKIIR